MSPTRYARSAIALHWAIALLILFQLGLGWRMTGLPQGATGFAAFQFHKSVGILILTLTLIRVGVRIVKPRPAPVAAGRLAAGLAKAVHAGLYLFMIGGPLTGWALVSTAGLDIPTRLFGTIPWPHLPLAEAWHGLFEESHELLAWIGIGLVLLHVAGAIRHHLGAGERENVVGRMVPVVDGDRSERRAIPAVLIIVASLAAAFAAPWLLYRPAAAVGATQETAPVAEETPAEPIATEVETGPEALPQDEEVAAEPEPENPAASATPTPAASAAAKPAPPPVWQVAPGGTLAFVASMNGAPIQGRFERWSADIRFDPRNLPASSIAVTVPLSSANTGDASRDTMLKGADFFGGVGETARFSARTIRHAGGDRYKADGTLTMGAISRPVTLDFTLAIDGDSAHATGTTRLDRTAFGIGKGDWASTGQIAAGVDVRFDFTARRQ